MTQGDIEKAFAALDEELAATAMTAEIVVVGGAVLAPPRFDLRYSRARDEYPRRAEWQLVLIVAKVSARIISRGMSILKTFPPVLPKLSPPA